MGPLKSAQFAALVFLPKQRLNSSGSFVLEVVEDSCPVQDTALRSHQSPLCLLELPFGVAYSAEFDVVERRIWGHAESQS